MSKNRDLIYDMAEAPETEDFEQLDSEPLQLGGVGEDAPAANDRQVTTPPSCSGSLSSCSKSSVSGASAIS